MADVHTAEARSRNMAAIRHANTRPEVALRHLIFAHGLRYRLHDRNLPGRPDLVLRKHDVVIFVHGCFFHGHECPAFRWPATRGRFWRAKIVGNRARDQSVIIKLREMGWRVLVVWECALRGPSRLSLPGLRVRILRWLKSRSAFREIAGSMSLEH
jgi:DNA mismatch endonuclease (patch repair protein)